MHVRDLPGELVERVVMRVRGFGAEPIAVIATGSFARGGARRHSDLDLTGLFRADPGGGYRTWFEPWDGGQLHVSVDVTSLTLWLAAREEPAGWSLGFPTDEAACFLWSTDEARRAMGDPPRVLRPAGKPELEDFVECAMKVRAAWECGDGEDARWNAHSLGRLAPGLLIPLNLETRVADRREALRAALALQIAPTRWRDDLAACLGIREAADGEVAGAAERLARGILALLRERKPDVDPQPWIGEYLADGTLERRLEGWE